ncbi:MAG: class B sortase [Eubacteriales bacterium]|nr:class B sortase [Eubacteriales bacterium]
MKKLYIYCGVVLCLIAACLVFFALQPKLFPLESASPGAAAADTPIPGKEAEETPYSCPEKLTAARNTNPDVYAWLYVPGTNIDYPVLQSPTDDSYYLARDINGDYLPAGSVMSEHAYNGTDFSDPVTILYGHCMMSGAMFGQMQSYYSSENGLEDYKTIEVYTPDKRLEYEAFAAVPYDMRHILYNYDFSNPRIFFSFFKSIVSIRSFNANINPDEKPRYGDHVLILSTCLKGDSTRRYLVMAKLK